MSWDPLERGEAQFGKAAERLDVVDVAGSTGRLIDLMVDHPEVPDIAHGYKN